LSFELCNRKRDLSKINQQCVVKAAREGQGLKLTPSSFLVAEVQDADAAMLLLLLLLLAAAACCCCLLLLLAACCCLLLLLLLAAAAAAVCCTYNACGQ